MDGQLQSEGSSLQATAGASILSAALVVDPEAKNLAYDAMRVTGLGSECRRCTGASGGVVQDLGLTSAPWSDEWPSGSRDKWLGFESFNCPGLGCSA